MKKNKKFLKFHGPYYYVNKTTREIGMYLVVEDEKHLYGGYEIWDKDNLPVHHLKRFLKEQEAIDFLKNYEGIEKEFSTYMVHLFSNTILK